MWLGRHDRCKDAPKPADGERPLSSLLRTPLLACGGVVFYHLPKAAGSTIECFLGAQREFACCYRGTCGYCRRWGGADGSCDHRNLLPSWPHGSTWGGKGRFENTSTFVVPGDLFRIPNGSHIDGDDSILRRLRVVVAAHNGPAAIVPGMSLGKGSMLLQWSYWRTRFARQVNQSASQSGSQSVSSLAVRAGERPVCCATESDL